MIPISRACDVENISDFARYYQNSWVGWHSPDSDFIIPAMVSAPGVLDTVHLRLLRKEKDDFSVDRASIVSWKSLLESIDFGIPEIGMFQDGPTLSYFSYSSPRAARKGFRPRELTDTTFNRWAIRKRYVHGRDMYDKIWHAFNPTYKSLADAVKALDEGERVGVPISKIMGVYTLPKYKTPIFAYKRWSIGHVENSDLIQIKSPFADYATEIERQTGAKVVVG